VTETSNTKHSARVDDVLAAEIEADEDLELPVEAPTTPLPGPLTEAERQRRSELAIALRPGAFPADRGRLLQVAHSEHATEPILELLEALPIDTRFDTVQDVWEAAGGHRESRDLPAAVPSPLPSTAPRSGATGSPRAGALTIALGVVATGFGFAVDVARAVVRGAQRVVPAIRFDPRNHG
jgi:hypothetical protein